MSIQVYCYIHKRDIIDNLRLAFTKIKDSHWNSTKSTRIPGVSLTGAKAPLRSSNFTEYICEIK